MHSRLPPDWMHTHDKERERERFDAERRTYAAEELQLRNRYDSERAAALAAFLTSPESHERFESYFSTFRDFYERVEPDRHVQAAKEAANGKIEREHFTFPDFGVWLLEQRCKT